VIQHPGIFRVSGHISSFYHILNCVGDFNTEFTEREENIEKREGREKVLSVRC
jgi:hypothetical protein